MKYDITNHKLVEIDHVWINRLFVFRDTYHPELRIPTSKYGRINAINTGILLNKLAELYFKEIYKVI